MINVDNSWKIILQTGETAWVDINRKYAGLVELKNGNGSFIICQLKLNHRIKTNSTAAIFGKH